MSKKETGPQTEEQPLYDTLFKISQGDVNLYKAATEQFLTAIAAATGRPVLIESSTADQSDSTNRQS
ncbi:MAG TPA: hypothetical protein VI306_09920 [Pyrinomonadaceae bacterium]